MGNSSFFGDTSNPYFAIDPVAAANSATEAAASASEATNQAAIATTQAGIATTKAATATTKAADASTSATSAATSETNAAASAINASTSETNAATSASQALTSKNNAATSEANAASSASAAATNATNAATSASSASTDAATATTQAGLASTYAASALASTTFTQAGTGAISQTWQDKARITVHVKDYGAKCDAVQVAVTATMTAGSPYVLQATGASFTSADVGKSITVPGAGASGAPLMTTIAAWTDATHVTLASPSLTPLAAVVTTVAYGTDDTLAYQRAVNYLLPIGGRIHIYRRSYISAPIVVDYTTTDTQQVGNQNTTVNFSGDGSGNSQLIHSGFSTGSGAVLEYRGKNLSGSLTSKHFFDGFSIMAAQIGTGTGLSLTTLAFSTFVDVSIFSMSTALTCVDVLTSSFYGCLFFAGVFGLSFTYSSFSNPNAISFFGTSIIGFNTVGLSVTGGTSVQFHGGSLERCGVYGTGTRYAAIFSDTGVDGGTAFAAYGLHVEANLGNADFFFSQTTANPALIVFSGCNFNRGSTQVINGVTTTLKTTNNILVALSGSAGRVDLSAKCSFRHFSPYTPTTSEPAIAVTGGSTFQYSVDTSGSYFGDPAYRYQETTPLAHATVKFAGTGTTGPATIAASHNVKSVTRNSVGNYTITFRNPLRGSVPIVNSGYASDLGWLTDFGSSSTTVTVRWFNSSGALSDTFTSLYVTVFDAG